MKRRNKTTHVKQTKNLKYWARSDLKTLKNLTWSSLKPSLRLMTCARLSVSSSILVKTPSTSKERRRFLATCRFSLKKCASRLRNLRFSKSDFSECPPAAYKSSPPRFQNVCSITWRSDLQRRLTTLPTKNSWSSKRLKPRTTQWKKPTCGCSVLIWPTLQTKTRPSSWTNKNSSGP